MPTIGFEIKRKCKVCGKVFVAKTLDSYYCSQKCGKVAWKRKKDVKDRNAKLGAIAQSKSVQLNELHAFCVYRVHGFYVFSIGFFISYLQHICDTPYLAIRYNLN